MSSAWKTIPQMVFAQAEANRAKTVLQVKRLGIYQEISWDEFKGQIEQIALALLDLGIQPGDRAAILSENRPEWAVADLGILSAGGVTVPIYTTLTSEEIGYILKDAQAHLIFVSSPELMAKIVPHQEKMALKVVLLDAPYRVSGPRVWWFGELLGLGKTAGPSVRSTLKERLNMGNPEALASIIYTSGTTGPPKGVMLTHDNFLSNCRAVKEVLPVTQKDVLLSFLPLSHVFERMAGYYFVLCVGGRIAYAESIDTVATNMLEVRPTVMTAVPRFYEKMYERIQEQIQSAPAVKRMIFRWAQRLGRQRSQRLVSRRPVPPMLALQYPIADRLVFSKLRAHLGGRLRFFVSGSAPLSKELAEFFHAAGILILEGYGLTETSPVISVNRPDRFRFGSVGIPLPGVEVRIAGDGEILTRGTHVMKGYFNQPEPTQEVIDSEGWFHTGDIGTLDADGFLTITDRKKDLIKTSGGKMVAPQNLENTLRRDPLIADCVVIGDRRKYLTALIVPNPSKVTSFAKKEGLGLQDLETLLRHPRVVELFQQKVEDLNSRLASFEQLKRFTLLAEPFTLTAGELTPTLKVKRRVIAERYTEQIEAMYRE